MGDTGQEKLARQSGLPVKLWAIGSVHTRVGHSLPLAAACWWCHFQPLWPSSITPLMPNQQPSLWSTVFLVTVELVYAPTCLLVSGESSHACLPYLSSNGATSHYGTTQGPSLFPNHTTFAFRTQCCPEGPGQSGLSSHSVCHRTMSSGVRVHPGGSWELEEHPVRVLLLSSTSALCSAICCIPLLTPTASGKHQDV